MLNLMRWNWYEKCWNWEELNRKSLFRCSRLMNVANCSLQPPVTCGFLHFADHGLFCRVSLHETAAFYVIMVREPCYNLMNAGANISVREKEREREREILNSHIIHSSTMSWFRISAVESPRIIILDFLSVSLFLPLLLLYALFLCNIYFFIVVFAHFLHFKQILSSSPPTYLSKSINFFL